MKNYGEDIADIHIYIYIYILEGVCIYIYIYLYIYKGIDSKAPRRDQLARAYEMIYNNLTNISYPIYNHTYFILYIEYRILYDKCRVLFLKATTCIPDHQMEIPGTICCPRGGPLGYIFCISDSPAKLIAQHCISANKAWTNSGECLFAIRQLAR
mgnify:CR=1 FL=1